MKQTDSIVKNPAITENDSIALFGNSPWAVHHPHDYT